VSARYTLITGASAGIGKELATACAKRGFNILLVALPASGLPELSKHLQQNFGVLVEYIECDLANPSSVQDIHQWCTGNGYEVDKLINNAGIGCSSPFETLSTKDIQAMIQLNACVLSTIINQFIPILKKQERAYILNVGSTASYFNIPNKALYAATKAFVKVLTTSLRNELRDTNISLSVLCPGGSTHKVDAVVRSKTSRFLNLLHEEPATIAEAGVSGMLKEKRMIFPGWVTKIYVVTCKVLPVTFLDFLVRTLFNQPQESSTPQKRKRALLRWTGATTTVALLLFITILFLDSNIPARQATGSARTLWDAVRYLKSNPSVSTFTTLNSDVAYVLRNDRHVYVYDPQHQKLEAKIPIHDNGTFKGLVHNNGSFYLLREDGYILTIQKKNTEYEITGYDVPLNTSDNLQGLYLDSANNRLLIDAQASPEDNDKNGMYGFDLASKSFINAGPIFFTNKLQHQ
jgi:short-subunit dehydrogenase